MLIKVKRIYEVSESNDGYRILVDKLWPRGIKKDDAKLYASPYTKIKFFYFLKDLG